MSLTTFFSGGQIDRAPLLRIDEHALREAWHATDTRFVVLWRSRCLVAEQNAVLLRQTELVQATLEDSIYLGRRAEQHLFALMLPDELPVGGPTESDFDNFRGMLVSLQDDDAALLAYAKGMLEWRERHRHCGRCGQPNLAQQGGFVMVCGAPGCDTRSFPRLDPAIITLTLHDDRALLGRQVSWPEGRYSTIAGFVEPGESLEDAVRREVHEETNIVVSDCSYLGSQPWPFPNAIMLGFHATAASTDIQLNDGELADARWFSRAELTDGSVALPPPQSIAFRLIERWFDAWDGAPLRSYQLSTDFRRASAQEDQHNTRR